MRQYNVFQAIYMSFYSRKLYKDVTENWGGYTTLYLLFLLALSWILYTFMFQKGLNELVVLGSDTIIPQIPVITIKNGIISTPEQRPYLIKNPKNENENIAIIDTSSTYKNINEANTVILITQNAIISKPKPNEIRISELPKTLNAEIDPKVWDQNFKRFVPYLWCILFPFLILVSFIYRLIQALVYAIIGKIFAFFCKVPLTYGHILQIAMVAITPVIVLTTIFWFFNITFAFQNLFYFLLAMIYLLYGIIANKTVYSKPN